MRSISPERLISPKISVGVVLAAGGRLGASPSLPTFNKSDGQPR